MQLVMAYLMARGVRVHEQDAPLMRAFYQQMVQHDFSPDATLDAFHWFRFGWNARQLEPSALPDPRV